MSGEGGDLTPCAHSWTRQEEDSSSSLARTRPVKSHEPFTIALQLPLCKSVLLSLLWGVLHVACHRFRPRIPILLLISNKPIFAGAIYVGLFISGQQRLGKKARMFTIVFFRRYSSKFPDKNAFSSWTSQVYGYWILDQLSSWLMAKDCWDLSSWQENTPVKLVSSINTTHGA